MTARPGRRRSWRLTLLGLLIAVVAVTVDWRQVEPLAGKLRAMWAARTAKPGQQPKETPAVPVSVAKAERGDYPVVLTGLGNVQPYNTVLIRTRVDGQITKLHFDEGEIVQKGDLLVEIDPRPFKAALDGAMAKKQQDGANQANAQRDLDRYKSLAKNDYATRQQLDTQTAQVAQLTAQIAADDAAIESAKTQLGYATIRAPITGRTGFRLVDEGNIVNAATQTGIVSIAQIEPIAVIFTAPEDELPAITSGQAKAPLRVSALTSDGGQVLADGQLETFNNEIDTASGTVRLKAAFDNKDHKLWPGLSVSTKLTVAVREGVVMIPFSAVQRSQDGLYTYVVGANNKVEQRRIKVSLSDDARVVVESGVQEGEEVVTAGQYRLQPGALIKVVPQPTQQTSQREP